MTQGELNRRVAEITGMTIKDSDMTIKAFAKVVEDTLKQDDFVQIYGFGKFIPVVKPGREMNDLIHGGTQYVPEHRVVLFRPGKTLKDSIKAV